MCVCVCVCVYVYIYTYFKSMETSGVHMSPADKSTASMPPYALGSHFSLSSVHRCDNAIADYKNPIGLHLLSLKAIKFSVYYRR